MCSNLGRVVLLKGIDARHHARYVQAAPENQTHLMIITEKIRDSPSSAVRRQGS